MVRRILHVDMDAFYAAVEQADHPELAGRPVIVGGSNRGVVTAASYEARKFGVRSAMPIFEARRLCPHAVFMPVNMQRYREVSRQIMGILGQLSPLVEQISIDEATLDITGTENLHGPPAALAAAIKQRIRAETALTCSIGIAPNKFLAKIASDMNKPDGLTIVEDKDVQEFLRVLPVAKVPGIGRATLQTMKALGVVMAADVLKFPRDFWMKRLGKFGERLYERAQGIDRTPVVPHSTAKSCSAEDTFARDTMDLDELRKWLLTQAGEVGRELRGEGLAGKTIVLKIKFADFRTVTRSRTLPEPTNCTQTIYQVANQLLEGLKISSKVRLTGVGVSNLSAGERQLKLFRDPSLERQEKLDQAVDRIVDRYGAKAIRRGRVFDRGV